MFENYLTGFAEQERVLHGLDEASVSAYLKKLKEFLEWLEGNGHPEEIDILKQRELIEQYLQWCFRRGNKNTTRNTKLTAITKFYRYLVYIKALDTDITADIPRPKTPRRFMQAYTREDVLRLFRAIPLLDPKKAEKALRDVVIIILGAFCGFRIDEALTTTLSSIEDDGKYINIHVEAKFGKHRSVYLWAAPSNFVRSYVAVRLGHGAKKDSPLLVSYNKGGKPKGNALTHGAIDQLIKGLAANAALRKPENHYHMFRAGHINDLQRIKGYTLPAIAKRVGHENIETTFIYIKDRDRIHHEYPSLAAFWKDFGPQLWEKGDTDANGSSHVGGGEIVE
ncbi:MAG: tyrosine-type recombinase/integrase [Nitrospirota bacterium]